MLCIFMTLMIMLNITMNITFMMLNHPLSMGMILMIQTTIIALISGLYSMSFWYSYILFLIMVGGMLVLFMYMTSLASNEKFKMSNKMIILVTIMIFSSILMILLMDNSLTNYMFKNNNLNELYNNINMFKNENIQSINMIYNYPNNMITIILINYLLLTLVAVVKITKSNTGPLRQKF
uniref:NADH-ubiquinone oxidoreductase chain 6 n=1 Tax=Hygrotus confluens TaxID=107884 RepID=A0A191ZRN2_9DYTI|nr:NADH dehydrogenase subunit 6 [Hygrotus confluens]